jgi:hypothetical protein
MQFAGHTDIGDETTAAAQQARVLDAQHGRADAFPRQLCPSVYCSSSRSRSSRW